MKVLDATKSVTLVVGIGLVSASIGVVGAAMPASAQVGHQICVATGSDPIVDYAVKINQDDECDSWYLKEYFPATDEFKNTVLFQEPDQTILDPELSCENYTSLTFGESFEGDICVEMDGYLVYSVSELVDKCSVDAAYVVNDCGPIETPVV